MELHGGQCHTGPWREPQPGSYYSCTGLRGFICGILSYWSVQEGKKKKVSFQAVIRLQCSGNGVSSTIKCCCARWKFVPSIWNNSRSLAVGTGHNEEQNKFGSASILCASLLFPSTSFLGMVVVAKLVTGTEDLGNLKKRSTCSEETYLRTDSPCVKVVSGYKILVFSAQERGEVVKFLTEGE